MRQSFEDFKEWSARVKKPPPKTCGHCNKHTRVHRLDVAKCGHVVLCDKCNEMMRDRNPTAAMAENYRAIMCPYCRGLETLPKREDEPPTMEPGATSADDESYASAQELA